MGAVGAGWHFRDQTTITAETGIGYGLGVAGASGMLLLLLYSARKRLRWMHGWGRLRPWFQVHMLLGILGPVAILFHANFTFGSTNSSVALTTMLIVMTSGIAGRFIYSKITHGLYGRRASLRELRERLEITKERLGNEIPLGATAMARLTALERNSLPAEGRVRRAARLLTLPLQAMRARRAIHRELESNTADVATRRSLQQTASEHIDAYVHALIKEAQFTTYERLFSKWHALHVPLLFLLIATGIVHVVAVHMY